MSGAMVRKNPFKKAYLTQPNKQTGVVLWEIMTRGQEPFAGMTNQEVVVLVLEEKGTLKAPQSCPPEVTAIMKKCWIEDPTQRTTFLGTKAHPFFLCLEFSSFHRNLQGIWAILGY
jgi:hypothetical protein